MTKKIYVDGFGVFCHCMCTEGTYQGQFGKHARFPIFHLLAKIVSSFQTKCLKCSYSKKYTLLNLIFGKYLEPWKELADLHGLNHFKNVGLV